MRWNDHSKLAGKHSALSPSQAHVWLKKSLSEIADSFVNRYASEIGTILHEYVAKRIKFGKRLYSSRAEKNAALFYLVLKGIPMYIVAFLSEDFDEMYQNMYMYVNDCITEKMDTEIILVGNPYCYGTADAIKYDEKHHRLFIFDFKTGKTKAHFDQLVTYAALFCIEYGIDTRNLDTELRLYQFADPQVYHPEPAVIDDVMRIIHENGLELQRLEADTQWA